MPSDHSAFADSHPDPEASASETDLPVRTDASTVFRSKPAIDNLSASPEPHSTADPHSTTEPQEIAEAHTIIRRPSHFRQDSSQPAPDASPPVRQTPAAVAKVLVGEQLGKFHIDRLIGGGGMGAVFLAHDADLDRSVAIKVIPFVEDDPDLQRRFRNECQLVAKLDHGKIAKVYDTGSHGQWHYIVFEYVEGVNIRDWVTGNGPLSIDDAVYFTAELADALEHLASRGIVHRDVKPSNILLSPDGTIKLVDLGLARSESYDFTDDMTASGVTLGTFDYISPEQAKDARAADLRSDIYSLGCTLYFMLTGEPPYPGGSMMNKLMSHSNEPPPNPQELRPEVSIEIVKLLAKMMAKKVNHRYQTGNNLVSDLRSIAIRKGLVRSMGLAPTTVTDSNRFLMTLEKHLPWLLAVGLMLVIAGWIHLDSRASRKPIVTPPSAKPLQWTQRSELMRPAEVSGSPWTKNALPPFLEAQLNSLPNESLPNETLSIQAERSAGEVSAISDAPSVSLNRGTQPAIGATERGNSLGVAGQPKQGLVISQDPSLPSRGLLGSGNEISDASMMGPRNDRLPLTGVPAEVNPSQPLGKSVDAGLPVGQRDGKLIDSRGDEFVPSLVRVVAGLPSRAMRRIGGDELQVESLADAFTMAKEYQLETIDLACARLTTSPISVNVNNIRLESSVGGCVIEFDSGDAVSMSRPVMCDLGNSMIEFEDIHFVWSLPEDEVDGGAMFEMNAGSQIRMTRCTLTINNTALRDEVYAFDVITDPDRIVDPEERRSAMSEPFPLVAIDMADTVVRGQMTMVHMDYAAKLWLTWDNGLLAITERMIDTAGARAPVSSASGPIRLSLSRVTCHSAKGICRVRLGVSGAYPFMIERSARSSVFMVEPTRPHFEVINFPLTMDADEAASVDGLGEQSLGSVSEVPLRLDGSSNAYVVQPTLVDPLLRISDAIGDVWTIQMSDLAAPKLSWADENLPRWNVIWTNPPKSDRLVSAAEPADYRQEGTLAPGFEEKTLPIPPSISN